MKKLLISILSISVLLILAGCAQTVEQTPQNLNTISFEFSNLEPLAQGHYEGWAIIGEEKVSTGKFNFGDDLSFTLDRDLSTASKIVLTIEPEGDTDEIPSGIVVLEGDLQGDNANLQFPVDLSDVSGRYILATPTNGGNSDETSGIWFLELPPSIGLILPDLPNGWIYEGWVVNQDTPLTTGKFSKADEADDFDGYSGPTPGPNFPGEDFLENAPEGLTFPAELADGESVAVISIEPHLDGVDPTGDTPFSIKPLVGQIPQGAQDHVEYDLDSNLETVPTGTASLQ